MRILGAVGRQPPPANPFSKPLPKDPSVLKGGWGSQGFRFSGQMAEAGNPISLPEAHKDAQGRGLREEREREKLLMLGRKPCPNFETSMPGKARQKGLLD